MHHVPKNHAPCSHVPLLVGYSQLNNWEAGLSFVEMASSIHNRISGVLSLGLKITRNLDYKRTILQ